MVKKNISFIISAALFTATMMPMVIFADPLDPDHFQGGTWVGTYTSSYCEKNYSGKATVTIINPVYTPPAAHFSPSKVHFAGSIVLTGGIPDGFKTKYTLDNNSYIAGSKAYNGIRYDEILYSDDYEANFNGYFFLGAKIMQLVGNSSSADSCKLAVNIFPQG